MYNMEILKKIKQLWLYQLDNFIGGDTCGHMMTWFVVRVYILEGELDLVRKLECLVS